MWYDTVYLKYITLVRSSNTTLLQLLDSVEWSAVIVTLLCLNAVLVLFFVYRLRKKRNNFGVSSKSKHVQEEECILSLTKQKRDFQSGTNGFKKIEAACMIPCHVLDLQEKEIMEWRERHMLFEETTASKRILDEMKTLGFLILSGPPGCGKSAIAYNTAFMLEKTAKFKILPISSPEEIRKYLSPERKQIFVIDDPVGRYAVDETSIRRWKNEENFIKETFTNSLNTKLILTCRSYIYKSGFSRLLHVSPIHYDLLSYDLKLSLGERTKLCQRYNLPDLNKDTIMMYDFFPLLCAMYSTLEDTSMFFVNPYKILIEEIGNIKENSDIAFLAIALLVVQDDDIAKQSLSLENQTIKELLNDLCNECGFKYFPSTSVLLSALYDLIGTYVKGTEYGFACTHDKLFQNISFIVGSGIIHCVLKYGSCKFLANRLQLASVQQEHDKLVIVVKQEQEKLFFERLLLDIRKGNHRHVFTGIQMEHLRFRTKLLTYLKTLKTGDLKCDQYNSTPLHVASEQGYDDLANFLVKLKKNQINHQDKNKRTPLYMACLGGHDNVVRVIHLNDKTTLEITNDDDCTPLDAASINGHSSTVALLLEYDANYKRKDKKIKRTALYRACENGHYDVVRLLLTKNPDVNYKDAEGLKAIHIACLSEHLSIVELLLGYKDIINECDVMERTPLFIACDSNQQNLVELLLQYKPDVNKTNTENFTPLHKACQNKNEIIVGLLLDKSAKVNKQSDDGSSPLYIACAEGQLRMVETLLNKKAQVNIATIQAWTPLLISCSLDHFEICKVLQRSGANINTADKFEFTPLHIACREKHTRIVRFLIECDANVNAVNRQKESPLYISCMNESSEIVEILLGKNADVKLCDKQGNSPLHAACQKGNKKIVQLLLAKKADTQKRNIAGNTPFDVVQGIERDKIVEMLNSETI